MNRILAATFAAAMLASGSLLSAASAMPAPSNPAAGITATSSLPIVEARARHHARFKAQHRNRGHHYGWQRGRGNPHRR